MCAVIVSGELEDTVAEVMIITQSGTALDSGTFVHMYGSVYADLQIGFHGFITQAFPCLAMPLIYITDPVGWIIPLERDCPLLGTMYCHYMGWCIRKCPL